MQDREAEVEAREEGGTGSSGLQLLSPGTLSLLLERMETLADTYRSMADLLRADGVRPLRGSTSGSGRATTSSGGQGTSDSHGHSAEEDGAAALKKRGRKKKDPGAPKGPLCSYMLFLSQYRERRKAEQPDILQRNISKEAGELWRNLSEEGKKPFEEAASQLKEQYGRDLQQWKDGNKDHAITSSVVEAATSAMNLDADAATGSSMPVEEALAQYVHSEALGAPVLPSADLLHGTLAAPTPIKGRAVVARPKPLGTPQLLARGGSLLEGAPATGESTTGERKKYKKRANREHDEPEEAGGAQRLPPTATLTSATPPMVLGEEMTFSPMPAPARRSISMAAPSALGEKENQEDVTGDKPKKKKKKSKIGLDGGMSQLGGAGTLA